MTKVEINGRYPSSIVISNEAVGYGIRNVTNTNSYLTNPPSSSTIIISNDYDILGDIPKSPEPVVKKIRKIYTKRTDKEPKPKRPRQTVVKEPVYAQNTGLQNVNLKTETFEECTIPMQCNGPACVKAVQRGSKYCSYECGCKLAEERLKRILKCRVKDYYEITSAAENNDNQKILAMNRKKASVEQKIEVANVFASTLDVYLFQLAGLRTNPIATSCESETTEQEILVLCMLCNTDIQLNVYQSHINSCITKNQRRSRMCSTYSLEKNPHNIICNEYIPTEKAYCRRIRSACTEHFDNESKSKICGYPLKLANENGTRIEDLFALELNDLVSSGICNRSHKACRLHPQWEANLRSLLDNHRMNLLICLDEISIEYHRLQETYQTRGDALTLLSSWRQFSSKNESIC